MPIARDLVDLGYLGILFVAGVGTLIAVDLVVELIQRSIDRKRNTPPARRAWKRAR